MPDDFVLQVQGELLVTERKWCDFISFSGGLPMVVIRVFPDPAVQDAISTPRPSSRAASTKRLAEYHATLVTQKWVPTERTVEEEMVI
jgi:hypothetical protein